LSNITTTAELASLEQSMARITIEYNAFIDFTLKKIIDDTLIRTIHNKMRRDGRSEKIIAATFLFAERRQGTGIITYFVISNYNADTGDGKFPVAIFIEEGRRAYIVSAPPPTTDRSNPHLRFETKEGEIKFRKSVKIPRFIAKKYIEETIQEMAPILQDRFEQAQRQWLAENGIPIN